MSTTRPIEPGAAGQTPDAPRDRARYPWLHLLAASLAAVGFSTLVALIPRSPANPFLFFTLIWGMLFAWVAGAAHQAAAPIRRPFTFLMAYSLSFPLWAAAIYISFAMLGFMLGQADGLPEGWPYPEDIERKRRIAIILVAGLAATFAAINAASLWWFTFRVWVGVAAAAITFAAILLMNLLGNWSFPLWHAAMACLLAAWAASTHLELRRSQRHARSAP